MLFFLNSENFKSQEIGVVFVWCGWWSVIGAILSAESRAENMSRLRRRG